MIKKQVHEMQALELALKHIQECAEIPSFSSYEERLHPYIGMLARTTTGVREIDVPGNNRIITVPGNHNRKPVALTAHLDKINHYGSSYPKRLPVEITEDHIEGAMDNCVGLGILLTIMQLSKKYDFPPLYLFMSEMEESYGLRKHPELLKNKGKNRSHGMGARRISDALLKIGHIPAVIITVDTTPLFKGRPGVALYSEHWEYHDNDPTPEHREHTQQIVNHFSKIYPALYLANNTNDYLIYGEAFNKSGKYSVPSVALEPSIHPYHQKGERVFISDIQQVLDILIRFLESG